MNWVSRPLWLGKFGALLAILMICTAGPVYAQGFFESLFGGPRSQPSPPPITKQRVVRPRPDARVESTRAPAPRRNSSKENAAATILVFGDGMAEWLASGLEDVLSETPQIGVQRKISLESGLVRYADKSDGTWPLITRDILSKEKADYVVVMLGLNDRQDIQEKSINESASRPDPDKEGGGSSAMQNETQAKKSLRALAFRSDEWTRAYTKRIDDMSAVLKNKGAPVFWVGLPPVRGSKSMSDLAFLNDLYKSRAERGGITFIDVWEGFVDDDGKYSAEGPDFEGQTRRLRSSDGVFFTKSGAQKLGRYVEREVLRYISGNPSAKASPNNSSSPDNLGQSVERPLSGPVFSLTTPLNNADELLGAGKANQGDTDISAKVLKKGEAIAAPMGRADNFSWPLAAVESQNDISRSGFRDVASKRIGKN